MEHVNDAEYLSYDQLRYGQDDFAELVRRSRNGDREARECAIGSYLPFVTYTARRYVGYGIPLDDLVSEGYVGLVMAFDRFNPEKKTAFHTYAYWWIRKRIQNFIIHNWRLVIPSAAEVEQQLFGRVHGAAVVNILPDPLIGGEEDLLVAEDPCGVASHCETQLPRDLSLNLPVSDQDADGETWLELLQDDSPDPEERVWESELSPLLGREVEGALSKLSERERVVVELRMMRDEPLTLQEIATQLSITKQAVNMIEQRVTAKLRNFLAAPAREAGYALDVEEARPGLLRAL